MASARTCRQLSRLLGCVQIGTTSHAHRMAEGMLNVLQVLCDAVVKTTTALVVSETCPVHGARWEQDIQGALFARLLPLQDVHILEEMVLRVAASHISECMSTTLLLAGVPRAATLVVTGAGSADAGCIIGISLRKARCGTSTRTPRSCSAASPATQRRGSQTCAGQDGRAFFKGGAVVQGPPGAGGAAAHVGSAEAPKTVLAATLPQIAFGATTCFGPPAVRSAWDGLATAAAPCEIGTLAAEEEVAADEEVSSGCLGIVMDTLVTQTLSAEHGACNFASIPRVPGQELYFMSEDNEGALAAVVPMGHPTPPQSPAGTQKQPACRSCSGNKLASRDGSVVCATCCKPPNLPSIATRLIHPVQPQLSPKFSRRSSSVSSAASGPAVGPVSSSSSSAEGEFDGSWNLVDSMPDGVARWCHCLHILGQRVVDAEGKSGQLQMLNGAALLEGGRLWREGHVLYRMGKSGHVLAFARAAHEVDPKVWAPMPANPGCQQHGPGLGTRARGRRANVDDVTGRGERVAPRRAAPRGRPRRSVARSSAARGGGGLGLAPRRRRRRERRRQGGGRAALLRPEAPRE